jgi:hypothetical protein
MRAFDPMRLSALVAVGVLFAASARAQDLSTLRPEQRVRVQAPGLNIHSRTAATVIEVRRDTLVVQIGSRNRVTGEALGVQTALPFTEITRLEVSQGKGNRARNAAFGLVVGTAAGAAAAVLHDRLSIGPTDSVRVPCQIGVDCPFGYRNGPPEPDSREKVIITGVGAGLGLLFGALFPADRWIAVPVRPRVRVVPAGGSGTEMGLVVAW